MYSSYIPHNTIPPKDTLLKNILLLTCLSLIAFVYYHDIMNYWFLSDDAAAIVSSTALLKEIFFSRIYSSFFYTPLVALSFKPDVVLFGINPIPYHIHNTIIIILISFMVYKILRLYTDSISALLPAIIVLLSSPSLICLLWITLRQYLYAMLFALLAVYLFLKYKPELKTNKLLVFIIMILSELSFMGKEQFMTLPFVLFILSKGHFQQRLYKTFPYFIVLLGHFFIRLYVLQGTGGYLGFHYDPIVYLSTIYKSFFSETKVLFGYIWLIILILLPLILKPKYILIAVILWLSSLSISFITMYFPPQVDTYRYWFISTIVFCFLIGFSMNIISNNLLKTIYLFLLLTFFLPHTFIQNKDIKLFVKNEALLAKSVTKAMSDKKYHNSLILFPDSSWLANSNYIHYMSEAYRRVSDISLSIPFFPLKLLSFYPGLIKDFSDIYEIKNGEIQNVTSSINEKINIFRSSLSHKKPEIMLFKNNGTIMLNLHCTSVKGLVGFNLKMNYERPYSLMYFIPYVEQINLTRILNITDAYIYPIEKISYRNKKWFIEEKLFPNNASFITIMCFDETNRFTHLSDAIIYSE